MLKFRSLEADPESDVICPHSYTVSKDRECKSEDVQINLKQPVMTKVHLNPPKLDSVPASVAPGDEARVLQTLTNSRLLSNISCSREATD